MRVRRLENAVRSKVERHGLSFSIHLLNRVTQGDRTAARGFGGVSGRVLGKFCLMAGFASKLVGFATRSMVARSSCPSECTVDSGRLRSRRGRQKVQAARLR